MEVERAICEHEPTTPVWVTIPGIIHQHGNGARKVASRFPSAFLIEWNRRASLGPAGQIAKQVATFKNAKSFGRDTRNRSAAVATVSMEILVGRQDEGVGEYFTHAHKTSISEAHGNVAVFLYKP